MHPQPTSYPGLDTRRNKSLEEEKSPLKLPIIRRFLLVIRFASETHRQGKQAGWRSTKPGQRHETARFHRLPSDFLGILALQDCVRAFSKEPEMIEVWWWGGRERQEPAQQGEAGGRSRAGSLGFGLQHDRGLQNKVIIRTMERPRVKNNC